MGHCQGAQQPECAAAPGTSRQYSDFKPWRRRSRGRFSLERGLIQHPDKHINAFLNQCPRLEMTAPHLAGSIGKAEMKVHALRSDGAIQGDHFEIALQHGGLRLAGALESCAAEVADHPQHKSLDSLRPGELLKAGAQIAAGSKLQRQ